VCDSCHSGGVTRNSEDDQNFVRRGITVDILDKDLDSQIRQRSTNEALKFGFLGNYSSHVLLAACAAQENAREDRSTTPRGVFTKALTQELRRLYEWKQLGVTTYSALMAPLRLYDQHPQYDGTVNRFLFSGRDKFGPCVFPITRNDDGSFEMLAGHAHGVVEGTEVTVYWEASALRDRGHLVVQSVSSFFSKVRRRRGEDFQIPQDAWAGIRRWGNTTALAIYTDSPLKDHMNSLDSSYPLNITEKESDARISLRMDHSSPPRIEMENCDASLAPHSKSFLDDQQLCSIMSKIAHFHYHLRRYNDGGNSLAEGERPLLRLYRRTTKVGDNLFKNNVAHIEIADSADSTAAYGIEIQNRSSLDLYAYLFAFNPFDYSIEVGASRGREWNAYRLARQY
jgi:hypothetical protein